MSSMVMKLGVHSYQDMKHVEASTESYRVSFHLLFSNLVHRN